MQILSIRDQIIACVTEAVDCTNRELEPIPTFEFVDEMILTSIAIRKKERPNDEVMRLNIEYRVDELIIKLATNIPIDISSGQINYRYVRSELMKIIPHSDRAYL